jgi:hypothetical protein
VRSRPPPSRRRTWRPRRCRLGRPRRFAHHSPTSLGAGLLPTAADAPHDDGPPGRVPPAGTAAATTPVDPRSTPRRHRSSRRGIRALPLAQVSPAPCATLALPSCSTRASPCVTCRCSSGTPRRPPPSGTTSAATSSIARRPTRYRGVLVIREDGPMAEELDGNYDQLGAEEASWARRGPGGNRRGVSEERCNRS